MNMVKIGEVYVDLDAVDAVAPSREEPGYSLFLRGGRILCLAGVSEREMITVLQQTGRVLG